jgi:predicted nucleic acid-binding protein
MKVIVDTSVWLQVLRRSTQPDEATRRHLVDLIDDLRVVMIGPIRQELLSGIPDRQRYEALRQALQPHEDAPLSTADYECAAELFNTCRRHGVQGSHIDFLICAVAIIRSYEIWTNDADLSYYAVHLPIQLHQPTGLTTGR